MSDDLANHFLRTRAASERFCEPLAIEDYGLQGMAAASPPKWHLAHTTWFFETFILKPFKPDYQPCNPAFQVLFNSYYNGIGEQHPRAERGLLSRPSVEEVLEYRQQVNEALVALLSCVDDERHQQVTELTELGIQHEQQHQELFFTDIKYSFSKNPLYPAYTDAPLSLSAEPSQPPAVEQGWTEFPGGTITVGHQGPQFCFDNELPRHQVLLQPYMLANRLVTNGEYLEFMDDDGYSRPELWLSDGWATVCQNRWAQPLYWVKQDNQWFEFTLHGLQPLDVSRPACHLSGYEADAFARWVGARLPTEFEWEAAASTQTIAGQFVEDHQLHPAAANQMGMQQLFGTAWEWTSSAYGPYPGYVSAAGAVGEYNGKFMANQLVLRGGSCVTSNTHIRASYRNFFYPQDRWQFSSIRLAKWL